MEDGDQNLVAWHEVVNISTADTRVPLTGDGM